MREQLIDMAVLDARAFFRQIDAAVAESQAEGLGRNPHRLEGLWPHSVLTGPATMPPVATQERSSARISEPPTAPPRSRDRRRRPADTPLCQESLEKRPRSISTKEAAVAGGSVEASHESESDPRSSPVSVGSEGGRLGGGGQSETAGDGSQAAMRSDVRAIDWPPEFLQPAKALALYPRRLETPSNSWVCARAHTLVSRASPNQSIAEVLGALLAVRKLKRTQAMDL